MSDELLNRGIDHPCKKTCSGWQQGYDKAVYDIFLNARVRANKTIKEMAEFFGISASEFCNIQFGRKNWYEVIKKTNE